MNLFESNIRKEVFFRVEQILIGWKIKNVKSSYLFNVKKTFLCECSKQFSLIQFAYFPFYSDYKKKIKNHWKLENILSTCLVIQIEFLHAKFPVFKNFDLKLLMVLKKQILEFLRVLFLLNSSFTIQTFYMDMNRCKEIHGSWEKYYFLVWRLQ